LLFHPERVESPHGLQYLVVPSVQTNATASMSYNNGAWNGNIFAAFK